MILPFDSKQYNKSSLTSCSNYIPLSHGSAEVTQHIMSESLQTEITPRNYLEESFYNLTYLSVVPFAFLQVGLFKFVAFTR